jgi:hypothetical protein
VVGFAPGTRPQLGAWPTREALEFFGISDLPVREVAPGYLHYHPGSQESLSDFSPEHRLGGKGKSANRAGPHGNITERKHAELKGRREKIGARGSATFSGKAAKYKKKRRGHSTVQIRERQSIKAQSFIKPERPIVRVIPAQAQQDRVCEIQAKYLKLTELRLRKTMTREDAKSWARPQVDMERKDLGRQAKEIKRAAIAHQKSLQRMEKKKQLRNQEQPAPSGLIFHCLSRVACQVEEQPRIKPVTCVLARPVVKPAMMRVAPVRYGPFSYGGGTRVAHGPQKWGPNPPTKQQRLVDGGYMSLVGCAYEEEKKNNKINKTQVDNRARSIQSRKDRAQWSTVWVNEYNDTRAVYQGPGDKEFHSRLVKLQAKLKSLGYTFRRARDSTFADIETNPGPGYKPKCTRCNFKVNPMGDCRNQHGVKHQFSPLVHQLIRDAYPAWTAEETTTASINPGPITHLGGKCTSSKPARSGKAGEGSSYIGNATLNRKGNVVGGRAFAAIKRCDTCGKTNQCDCKEEEEDLEDMDLSPMPNGCSQSDSLEDAYARMFTCDTCGSYPCSTRDACEAQREKRRTEEQKTWHLQAKIARQNLIRYHLLEYCGVIRNRDTSAALKREITRRVERKRVIRQLSTLEFYGHHVTLPFKVEEVQTVKLSRRGINHNFGKIDQYTGEADERKYTPWADYHSLMGLYPKMNIEEEFDALFSIQKCGATAAVTKEEQLARRNPQHKFTGLYYLNKDILKIITPFIGHHAAPVVEVQAPAAAGKSFFIQSNVIDSDLIVVPTYDQAKLHQSRLDAKSSPAVVLTPEVFYKTVVKDRRQFARIFIDECGLVDKNLLRLARYACHSYVVVVGHYDQVNWVNFTTYKGDLKQVTPVPDIKITMNRNYRSLRKIVDFTNALTGYQVKAMRGPGGEVNIEIGDQFTGAKVNHAVGHFQRMKSSDTVKGIPFKTTHEWQGNQAKHVGGVFWDQKSPGFTIRGSRTNNYDYVVVSRAEDELTCLFRDPHDSRIATFRWALAQPSKDSAPDLLVDGKPVFVGNTQPSDQRPHEEAAALARVDPVEVGRWLHRSPLRIEWKPYDGFRSGTEATCYWALPYTTIDGTTITRDDSSRPVLLQLPRRSPVIGGASHCLICEHREFCNGTWHDEWAIEASLVQVREAASETHDELTTRSRSSLTTGKDLKPSKAGCLKRRELDRAALLNRSVTFSDDVTEFDIPEWLETRPTSFEVECEPQHSDYCLSRDFRIQPWVPITREGVVRLSHPKTQGLQCDLDDEDFILLSPEFDRATSTLWWPEDPMSQPGVLNFGVWQTKGWNPDAKISGPHCQDLASVKHRGPNQLTIQFGSTTREGLDDLAETPVPSGCSPSFHPDMPGYCYLIAFNAVDWDRAALKHGKNPRARRLPRGIQRQLRVSRLGIRTHAINDADKPNGFKSKHWQKIGSDRSLTHQEITSELNRTQQPPPDELNRSQHLTNELNRAQQSPPDELDRSQHYTNELDRAQHLPPDELNRSQHLTNELNRTQQSLTLALARVAELEAANHNCRDACGHVHDDFATTDACSKSANHEQMFCPARFPNAPWRKALATQIGRNWYPNPSELSFLKISNHCEHTRVVRTPYDQPIVRLDQPIRHRSDRGPPQTIICQNQLLPQEAEYRLVGVRPLRAAAVITEEWSKDFDGQVCQMTPVERDRAQRAVKLSKFGSHWLPVGATPVTPGLYCTRLTCCGSQRREDETIVGWSKEALFTLFYGATAPSTFRCVNYICRRHVVMQPPLPFVTNRGAPSTATYPWHAHGSVARAGMTKKFEIVTDRNQQQVVDEDLWVALAKGNPRVRTGLKLPICRCNFCGQEGWIGNHNKCATCVGSLEFPQLPVISDAQVGENHRRTLLQVRFTGKTQKSVSLPRKVHVHWLNAIIVMDDGGKTLLWKTWPETFNCSHHQPHYAGVRPRGYLSAYDHQDRIFLTSPYADITYPFIRYLGAATLIGKKNFNSHNIDWEAQSKAIAKVGVPHIRTHNIIVWIGAIQTMCAKAGIQFRPELRRYFCECNNSIDLPAGFLYGALTPKSPCGHVLSCRTFGGEGEHSAAMVEVHAPNIRSIRVGEIPSQPLSMTTFTGKLGCGSIDSRVYQPWNMASDDIISWRNSTEASKDTLTMDILRRMGRTVVKLGPIILVSSIPIAGAVYITTSNSTAMAIVTRGAEHTHDYIFGPGGSAHQSVANASLRLTSISATVNAQTVKEHLITWSRLFWGAVRRIPDTRTSEDFTHRVYGNRLLSDGNYPFEYIVETINTATGQMMRSSARAYVPIQILEQMVRQTSAFTLRNPLIEILRVLGAILNVGLATMGFLTSSSVLLLFGTFYWWHCTRGQQYDPQSNCPMPNTHPLLTQNTELDGGEAIAIDPDTGRHHTIHDALAVYSFGSHGDHIPMDWLVRYIAQQGNRVHHGKLHTGGADHLKRLRAGDLSDARTEYFQLLTTQHLPFKHTLQPLIGLKTKTTSYSLSPSEAYINPFNFPVSNWQTILSGWFMKTLSPTVRVGSLRESIFPRSTDGRTRLVKTKGLSQEDRKGVFWLSGSEGEDIIPVDIRLAHRQLLRTDHTAVFQEVEQVYFHGGAGTCQTLLMSGVGVKPEHFCDDSLDRNYHTFPTTEDVMTRGPMYICGWLLWNGFRADKLNRVEKLYALFCWLEYRKFAAVRWALTSGVRIVITLQYAMGNLTNLLLLFFTVPWLYELSLRNITKRHVKLGLGFIYTYPWLFAAHKTSAALGMYVVVTECITKLVAEITNWKKNRTSLVITRASGFPLPFGHTQLRDNTTGEIYEGAFLGPEHSLGELFKFRKWVWLDPEFIPYDPFFTVISLISITNMLYFSWQLNKIVGASYAILPWFGILALWLCAFGTTAYNIYQVKTGGRKKTINKIEIPLPFTPAAVKLMVHYGEAYPYGAFASCHTALLPTVVAQSWLGAWLFILMVLCSWTILVPGDIAFKFWKWTRIHIRGVEFAAAINPNVTPELTPSPYDAGAKLLVVKLPRAGPIAALPPRAEPIAAPLPRAGPIAALPPRAEPIAAPLPRAGPIAALPPRAEPIAASPPRAGPIAALPPRAEPIAALSPRAEPVAANNICGTIAALVPLPSQTMEEVQSLNSHATQIRRIRRANPIPDYHISSTGKPAKSGEAGEGQALLDKGSVNDLDKSPMAKACSSTPVSIQAAFDRLDRMDEVQRILDQIGLLMRLATEGTDEELKKGLALTKDEARWIGARTLLELVKQGGPTNSDANIRVKEIEAQLELENTKPVTPYDGTQTWHHQVIAALRAITEMVSDRIGGIIAAIIHYIETRCYTTANFAIKVWHSLSFLAELFVQAGLTCINVLRSAVHSMIDEVFEPSHNKRLKTAWALAGLFKNPWLSRKKRFEENVAFASYQGRRDFIPEFQEMIDEINTYTRRQNKDIPELSLSSQFRDIRIGRPVMTDEQAEYLGLKPGEYVTTERNDDRNRVYREAGIPVSGDGVFLTRQNDPLFRSTFRYTPQYLDVPDKVLAHEVADALFEQYKPALADMQIMTPNQVLAYYKSKYAPGSPWISLYKTRRELEDAGITDALFEMIEDRLASGKYPTMFHKAFAKAQVVNLEKIRNGKNVRTVVAEELLTYFMNMCMELERNSRHDWESTGLGIGMPMNQNMIFLFNKLLRAQQDGHGVFANADATEYDSRTKPFTYEILGRLAQRGFNGAPHASVLQAKYDSLQHSFIFNETARNYNNSVSVIIDDENIIQQLWQQQPRRFIPAHELNSIAHELTYDGHEKHLNLTHPIHSLYRGRIILCKDELEVTRINQYGVREFTYLSPLYMSARATPASGNVACPQRQYNSMEDLETWLATIHENIPILYNVVEKNRGGGTGENATSWDNGWGFKGTFIAAWTRYMRETTGNTSISPKDFFSGGNVLFNTGDDSAIHLKVDPKTFNNRLFEKIAHEYGIDLEIEFFTDIDAVEYLGKSSRAPNTEDYEDLLAWQRAMYAQDRSQGGADVRQRGIPHRIVYQQTANSWLRQGANRYYQAQAMNSRYLVSYLMKNCGTAQIAAFNHTLFDDLMRNYILDLEEVAQRRFSIRYKAEIEDDQYGLPIITYPQIPGRTPKQLRKEYGWQPHNASFLRQPRLTKHEEFRLFLETIKFPSYVSVLKNHMKLVEYDPETEHETFKNMIKYKTKNRHLEAINLVVDVAQDYIDWYIPRPIYKQFASLVPSQGDYPFHTVDYTNEKWVYLKGKPETYAEFVSMLDRSPYSSVSNGSYFWQEIQDPVFRADVEKHDADTYGAKIIFGTFTYAMIFYIRKAAERVPLFGTLIAIFFFSLLDLPRLYAVASSIFWHGYCASSPSLSALMPKDPYIWAKRVVFAVLASLPTEIFSYPPFCFMPAMCRFAGDWCETGAQGLRGMMALLSDPGATSDAPNVKPFKNPWVEIVTCQNGGFGRLSCEETEWVLPGDCSGQSNKSIKVPKGMILQSAVATGKSSLLPYAILQHAVEIPVCRKINFAKHGGRIVITFPRRILVHQWASKLETSLYPVHKYIDEGKKKGIPTGTRIVLGTDGSILRAVENGLFNKSDLFLLDEFHLLVGAKAKLFETLSTRGFHSILLSATPAEVPGVKTNFYKSPIARRFTPTIESYPDGTQIIDVYTSYIYGSKDKNITNKGKILVKCTYLNGRNGCNEVKEQFEYHNKRCYILCGANSRDPIPDDIDVLICTEIINTGIDLPDGYDLMISDGKMHTVNEGVHSMEWADADTQHQGDGRPSRNRPGGVVFRPDSAGTGPKPINYCAMAYLDCYSNAALLDLPQLVSVDFCEKPLSTHLKDRYHFEPTCPWLGIRRTLSRTRRNMIWVYYQLINAGCSLRDLEKHWVDVFKRPMDEYQHIQSFIKENGLSEVPQAEVVGWLRDFDVVCYVMTNRTVKTIPPRCPINIIENGEIILTTPRSVPINQFYAAFAGEPLTPYRKCYRPVSQTAFSINMTSTGTRATAEETKTEFVNELLAKSTRLLEHKPTLDETGQRRLEDLVDSIKQRVASITIQRNSKMTHPVDGTTLNEGELCRSEGGQTFIISTSKCCECNQTTPHTHLRSNDLYEFLGSQTTRAEPVAATKGRTQGKRKETTQSSHSIDTGKDSKPRRTGRPKSEEGKLSRPKTLQRDPSLPDNTKGQWANRKVRFKGQSTPMGRRPLSAVRKPSCTSEDLAPGPTAPAGSQMEGKASPLTTRGRTQVRIGKPARSSEAGEGRIRTPVRTQDSLGKPARSGEAGEGQGDGPIRNPAIIIRDSTKSSRAQGKMKAYEPPDNLTDLAGAEPPVAETSAAGAIRSLGSLSWQQYRGEDREVSTAEALRSVGTHPSSQSMRPRQRSRPGRYRQTGNNIIRGRSSIVVNLPRSRPSSMLRGPSRSGRFRTRGTRGGRRGTRRNRAHRGRGD